jgi:hypothetical protein
MKAWLSRHPRIQRDGSRKPHKRVHLDLIVLPCSKLVPTYDVDWPLYVASFCHCFDSLGPIEPFHHGPNWTTYMAPYQDQKPNSCRQKKVVPKDWLEDDIEQLNYSDDCCRSYCCCRHWGTLACLLSSACRYAANRLLCNCCYSGVLEEYR